jgi:biofilm PGA synthesis N-glycosyltransferase PgaC
MSESTKYVIVTPIRDEAALIESTLNCVDRQTIRPAEWVLVDDGSTDGTGAIIDRYAGWWPWVRVLHRTNRGFRKSGAGVVEAFDEGYRSVTCHDWEFIVKLDGDLTFAPDYFERCLCHFEREPRLGIGGGEVYHDIDGNLKLEANPRFHVRGATKIYRRDCWRAISGLRQVPGWDTIDEVTANMLGWKSYSFPELRLVHHRHTGMAEGLLKDRVKHGVACYCAGYHPFFVAASCVYRLMRRPYVLGAGAMLWGFVKGHLKRLPRAEEAVVRYVQEQQLRRLCGMETIWK